jgi:hypothetical protein
MESRTSENSNQILSKPQESKGKSFKLMKANSKMKQNQDRIIETHPFFGLSFQPHSQEVLHLSDLFKKMTYREKYPNISK